MTPLAVPAAPTLPTQAARPMAALPAAPAPAPLAAPAMVARVEWAGAVRPPDALMRAMRPDLTVRATPEAPTGPPPAFAANVLDQIPDSLRRPDGIAADGDEAGRPEAPTTAPVPTPAGDPPAGEAGPAVAPDAAAVYGSAAAPAPQVSLWL